MSDLPKTKPALAQWLTELRENTGMTQPELATAADTGVRNIQRYESGETEPKGVEFIRLLEALGVSLVPSPPMTIPRAVNQELATIRQMLQGSAYVFRPSTGHLSESERQLLEVWSESLARGDDPLNQETASRLGYEDAERLGAMMYEMLIAVFDDPANIAQWKNETGGIVAAIDIAEYRREAENPEQVPKHLLEAFGAPRLRPADSRLEELRATVAGLASAEDVRLGFQSLEAAIERLARERRDEDPPQAETGG